MGTSIGAWVPGMDSYSTTRHATERIAARRLQDGAAVALAFGRIVRTREAEIYVVGRRQVEIAATQGIDLHRFEGVQVVCGTNGQVITAYKNRDLRGLKPRRRGRRWLS